MWDKWFDELKEDEVMIMIAIARKKYNEKLKSEEVVFREIVTKETWERKFNRLKTLVHHYPGNAKPEDYSVYMTYNPRSLKKALFLLQERLLKWQFELYKGNMENYFFHIRKLPSEFISCLQKPEARSRRWHFLIDVDDINRLSEVRRQISELGLKIKHEESSKNGFHILVEPFNILKWKPIENVEIKRDGIFHIYHVRRNCE